MADGSPLDRIHAAVSRIEAASERHAQEEAALTQRHAALRTRMAEAVAALDDVITRGTPE
jgi:hypothetical protein